MPEAAVLVPYVLACIAIVVIPGPTVSVIVANALRHGTTAGLKNVIGTQIGLFLMIVVVAAGLSATLGLAGNLFELLRIAGAAYLIWMGIRMWQTSGLAATREKANRPFGSFVVQGFLVIWSNPKALLLFGALIPQFVIPDRDFAWQTIMLGGIFMLVAILFDVLYAIVAGRARQWLDSRRMRYAERVSAGFLVAGGFWLAFSRR